VGSRKGCTHACALENPHQHFASILSSRTHACGLDNFFCRQDNPEGCSGHVTMLDVRQRPYRNEHTGSHPNSKVNRCRARSVLGWGTAWEALWVLLAFLRIKFLIRCRFDLHADLPIQHAIKQTVGRACVSPWQCQPKNCGQAKGQPDGNWSSFQLAKEAPPQNVIGNLIAPSARMVNGNAGTQARVYR
jgi:hypothetical protein